MESKENLQTKDKIQKVKEKMIPFVTNKWTIEVLKQVVFWFYVYVMAKCFEYTTIRIDDHVIKIAWYVAIFVIGLLIDIAFILIKTKLGNEMHKKFFILALTFGLLYMLICPFGTGTDEVSHFLRTYEISSKYTSLHYEDTTAFPRAFLKLADYRSSYDTGYKEYYYGYSGFYMQGDEKFDMGGEYWNTKLYSPIQYLPQAIGTTVGRILSDNILVIGYFARFFGFAFWLVVNTYAIKRVPNKKVFFTMLCLLPINIYTAVCLSGDTVTNAVCILFIALIYRKSYLDEKVSLKEKVLLIVCACVIALCKIVYLPFIFLSLLIKPDKFENKKSYIRFIALLLILSMTVGIVWLKIGSSSLVSSNEDSKKQLGFVIENPFDFLLITLNTIHAKGTDYIYQFATGGELLSHSKTTIYEDISYMVGLLLFISFLTNEDKKEKRKQIDIPRKLLVVLIMLGTSALIFVAIYVQWTSLFELASKIVLGVQGRYFIPVFALLIFLVDSIELVRVESSSEKKLLRKENLFTILGFLQIPIFILFLNTFII